MCAAVARARSYEHDEPDTIVVDVEEDDMQVKLQDADGVVCWHRRANTSSPDDYTACGRKYDFMREQLGFRLSRYEGQLCRGGPLGCCFTPFELEQAKKLREQVSKAP